MTPNVLFLSGSLRLERSNIRLARVAADQLPLGHVSKQSDRLDVPAYNADLDQVGQIPYAVSEIRHQIAEAAGASCCTPLGITTPYLAAQKRDYLDGRPPLPQSCSVGRRMSAALATGSLTNGAGCPSDLPKYWGIAGGLVVSLPDCIINQASDKFVEFDGALSLEPTSLKGSRLAVDGLVRSIESGAHRPLEEDWHAYSKVLTS